MEVTFASETDVASPRRIDGAEYSSGGKGTVGVGKYPYLRAGQSVSNAFIRRIRPLDFVGQVRPVQRWQIVAKRQQFVAFIVEDAQFQVWQRFLRYSTLESNWFFRIPDLDWLL